jgi:hypothetical protein
MLSDIAHIKTRDVSRTIYGYGRTPYGSYTVSDRTVYQRA